jgi:hypothetical protein
MESYPRRPAPSTSLEPKMSEILLYTLFHSVVGPIRSRIHCPFEVAGNGKVHPRTGHEGPELEKRYCSTLSLTSALDGGRWSTPCPGKKTLYLLYRRLGAPHGRTGEGGGGAENHDHIGIRSPDRLMSYRVAVPSTLPQP